LTPHYLEIFTGNNDFALSYHSEAYAFKMSASPVTVPAYWPKPNYVNPESRKGGAIAYNTVLMVVVVTIVSLRYYSRVGVLKQRLGLDDFFIGLSLVSLC